MVHDWRRRAAVVFALALAVLLVVVPKGSRAADFGLAPIFPGAVAGQTIEFQGTGFEPGEQVSIWATAPDGSVLGGHTVRANLLGEARLTFQLPFNAIGGTWAMTAWGRRTQTPVITYFDVAGRSPEQAPPQGRVSPDAGPAGTTFTFTAIGFHDGEEVSYWITGPGNVIYDAFPRGTRANGLGQVTVSWTPPYGAPAGTFVMTLQGIRSGVARGIAFELQ